MQARIVRIGNSLGIRIPKAILAECHFEHTVELEVRDGGLLLKPAQDKRAGWAEAFRQMAEHGDDVLLDAPDEMTTDWDETEWQWWSRALVYISRDSTPQKVTKFRRLAPV